MSKNKKQEALQKAQKYIEGSKLTKDGVKTLESKGFTSAQIQAVAGSMNVGGKAQDRIDSRHASSGGSSGGGSSKVRTLDADRRILVNSQGRAVDTTTRWNPNAVDSPGLILNQKQADKINKKVDKYGGSLTGGKGMTVAGFVTVTEPGRRFPAQMEHGMISPRAKHQLAIYAPAQRREGGGDGKSEAPSTGGSTGGSSGGGAPSSGSPRNQGKRTAYQRAQDHISGRTNAGLSPEMFPRGVRPGFAVEDVANYADRLGAYNANYSGWMQDRAEADRIQSGNSLLQFASILPKAPDVLSAKDLIEMANRMNKQIEVG